MTLLLQISDPHFGTEQPPVVEALAQLVRAQPPDVLLLSGDITQRATAAQFSTARAFVDRLQVPAVLAIPGNHDIPLFNLAARLLWPYARFKRAFGDDLAPTFENAAVLVLGVNTTRRWRHADGQVSAAQIEHVTQRLAEAKPMQWRIVLIHQPVAVTREQDRHNLLHGHAAAVRAWGAAGADMIVGGHIHLPFVLRLNDALPDAPPDGPPDAPLWAVQAGTAISQRVRADAGNSVNLIRIGSASTERPPCQVERWDYRADSRRFELVSVHPLRAA